ncbi:MAG: hypothetical protein LIO47_07800, partial [Akkermansia sp.]|nr:hypothetical protein [Akkermansia sp.]
MKIGIITIHYSFITRNYGSLMQLYAMQQVLAGMSVQSALVKQLPRPVPVPPRRRRAKNGMGSGGLLGGLVPA